MSFDGFSCGRGSFPRVARQNIHLPQTERIYIDRCMLLFAASEDREVNRWTHATNLLCYA
jgi:hypothetical protein